MASIEDDEDNIAEDECTMDFGEEELPAAPSSGKAVGPRFIEYPGEDFSKYLKESTYEPPRINHEDNQVCYTVKTQGDRRAWSTIGKTGASCVHRIIHVELRLRYRLEILIVNFL